MPPHVKNYLLSINCDISDGICCEICNSYNMVEIHHIKRRSEFGKKTKHLQDLPDNLIALCRTCHDKAHANVYTKPYLFELVKKRLNLYV